MCAAYCILLTQLLSGLSASLRTTRTIGRKGKKEKRNYWRLLDALRRTRWLTPTTTAALFVVDALGPLDDDGLERAADELVEHLVRLGPDVRVARRVLRAG